jgi:hypothetical protein
LLPENGWVAQDVDQSAGRRLVLEKPKQIAGRIRSAAYS